MLLGATRPDWSHASFLVSQAVVMLLLALRGVNLVRVSYIFGIRRSPERSQTPLGDPKYPLGDRRKLHLGLLEPNPAPGPPQGCVRYGPGSPPEAEIGCFSIGKRRILRKPTRTGLVHKCAPTLRDPLSRYRWI